MKSRPIYLHIFDRELRTLTRSRITDEEACNIVVTAALLSSSIYAGMANLLESQPDFPKAVKLVYALEQKGEAVIISSSSQPEAFIEGRRRLYFDDKERYPMYFESNDYLLPNNAYALKNSTTYILEEQLIRQLQEGSLLRELKNPDNIRKALLNRDESGITIGIVEKHTKLDIKERWLLGQSISKSYTRRYMEVLDGCLMKNIQDVSMVDSLSSGYYYYDIYYLLFYHLFFCHDEWRKSNQPLEERLVALRVRSGFWDLVNYINDIVDSLFCAIIRPPLVESAAAVICKGLVKKHIIPLLDKQQEINILQSMSALHEAVGTIANYEEIEITMKQDVNLKKVLLVVATDTEHRIIFDHYKQKNGISPQSVEIGKYSYRDLKIVGNSHLYLLKTNMGAKGNGGSILGINEAESSLKPDYVIMVGIGFGLKENKQSLGDIMVSTAIEDYGTVKLKEGEVISRGNRISADDVLVNRFVDSKLEWDQSTIHPGLIISNDVLVNDTSFVSFLKEHFPDAIGGEMEGCGLLANYQIPWVLVKGICDYGHDKNDENQIKAVQNAIKYVDFTLEKHKL